jgi:hypothetical protein
MPPEALKEIKINQETIEKNQVQKSWETIDRELLLLPPAIKSLEGLKNINKITLSSVFAVLNESIRFCDAELDGKKIDLDIYNVEDPFDEYYKDVSILKDKLEKFHVFLQKNMITTETLEEKYHELDPIVNKIRSFFGLAALG